MDRSRRSRFTHWLPGGLVGRHAKRAAIATVGATLLAAGAAMLVLPGPGLVAIVAGFAILGTEFAWARRAHHATARRARQARDRAAEALRRR